jgi:hypothetical protein
MNRSRLFGPASPDTHSEFSLVNLDKHLARKVLIVRWAALKSFDTDLKSLRRADLRRCKVDTHLSLAVPGGLTPFVGGVVRTLHHS